MNISIIIPTYNRAELLKKTLDSVVEQTSPNWECIVVDDFSKDHTKEIVWGYKHDDARFSYFLNEHKKGAQGARNTGLDHAKHEWVVFFDSDNFMHSDFVEVMLSNVKKNIDVLACCSDIVNVETGNTGRIMNPRCHGNIHDSLFRGRCYVDFNQSIIRKSVLRKIDMLDEECPSMQEWDTHIRLSNFATYDMVSKSLVDYYQGGGDAISTNPKREVIGRLYILRKHNKEWMKHFLGLTGFCYQILQRINKNTDSAFVKEKKEELRDLVPFYYPRIILWMIWQKIRY